MGMALNYLWLDDWHIVGSLFPFFFFLNLRDDDEMVYSLKKQSRTQNREETKSAYCGSLKLAVSNVCGSGLYSRQVY